MLLSYAVLSHVQLSVTRWTAARQAPWDSPGKSTGVGCHFLLQRIFPTQGSNPHLLHLQHHRQILYHLATWEAPVITVQFSSVA